MSVPVLRNSIRYRAAPRTAKVSNGMICAMEKALKTELTAVPDAELTEADCPVKHYFTPGIYCREIFMPAGSVIIGKIHRTKHINIISKGRAIVVTEDDGRMDIQAPYSFVSNEGCKKALFILKDMVWTTCHATEETDLVKLEELIIAPSYEALYHETPVTLEEK